MGNPQNIKLIVGLGNPGPQYQDTRHNLGFKLLDRLNASAESAPSWREQDGAATCTVQLESAPIILVKPLKYMNNSGIPLRALLSFYKIELSQVIAVYDDVDLPLGAIRIREGGGEGGHNGVRSIVAENGGKNFTRLKLGVGRPPPEYVGEDAVARWVLAKFQRDELSIVEQMLDRGVHACEEIVRSGIKLAQTRFNALPDKPTEL